MEKVNEYRVLIVKHDFKSLGQKLKKLTPPELALLMNELSDRHNVVVLQILTDDIAVRVFKFLPFAKLHSLLKELSKDEERLARLINRVPPDDRTSLLIQLPPQTVSKFMGLLSPKEYEIAINLLNYPEKSVGRLMTPDYVAVHPDWTVQQALDYIRTHGHDSETLNVIYVTDEKGRLIDDCRIRQLLLSEPSKPIAALLDKNFVALKPNNNQKTAIETFRKVGRVALPVIDKHHRLIGIVTIDDVLKVMEHEATKDIHKIGGLDELDVDYMKTPFWQLIKKRARWLVFLFIGEMLTATAMGHFENEIAKAVILALFVPLIISSGGNSGSQAATLVIRAMAVGDVSLRDWWAVMRRETFSGLTLGIILGAIGALRITIWAQFLHVYGEHWPLVAVTVGLALIGVVLWGTLVGSMLPFVLRRAGADPAVSSTPFVATLVDVTGLIIYFSMAALILHGTLL